MEPLTMGLLAGGMVGSSLLGGLMGSSGSGNTSREASRRATELARNQALINSQAMAPYQAAGQIGAQKLWGVMPTGQSGMAYPQQKQVTSGNMGYNPYFTQGGSSPGLVNWGGNTPQKQVTSGMGYDPNFTKGNAPGMVTWGGNTSGRGVTSQRGYSSDIPYLESDGSKWKSPTKVGSLSYTDTGQSFDRTGGAGQYIPQLQSLINSASTPGVNTQKFIDQLSGFGQNFKFDETDPSYKYKMQESEKDINRSLASRGLFDSRAGVNMLTDADRAIRADEYEKQYGRGYQTVSDVLKATAAQDEALLGRNVTDYNRQYGGLQDLFKMQSGLGETGYQSLLDSVKVGTGAAAAAGNSGVTGNAVSAYGQMANVGAQDDANKASLWSGIGAMPMNAMLLYNMLNGGNTQQNQIPYIPAR